MGMESRRELSQNLLSYNKIDVKIFVLVQIWLIRATCTVYNEKNDAWVPVNQVPINTIMGYLGR